MLSKWIKKFRELCRPIRPVGFVESGSFEDYDIKLELVCGLDPVSTSIRLGPAYLKLIGDPDTLADQDMIRSSLIIWKADCLINLYGLRATRSDGVSLPIVKFDNAVTLRNGIRFKAIYTISWSNFKTLTESTI